MDETKHLKYLHKIEEKIKQMEQANVTDTLIDKYESIYRSLLRKQRYKQIDDLLKRAEKIIEDYETDDGEDTT